MIVDLSIGFAAIVFAMIVHLGATILIVKLVRPLEVLIKTSPYKFIAITLVLTNTILFMTHLMGVLMWSSIYFSLDLTDNFPNAFYSAFIMNTTLGLGLIKPEIGTRLLAPMTATSGIMMIGWSTAVFVYVVQTYLPHVARQGKQ
ncbi:ion channel [Ancylobacter oerskovii]|uniref:Ion channel n=1 Tax=Ancylobacter oerskovii TaxID=459519 RepID=A0ABW4Z4L6_9HYPH|nr:ion channel [Ancylobacter oerskovii]MBS7544040.1 hypothetical protein [Ancylobacter oerskovii]